MYLKCDWKGGHSRKCLWWGRKWILAHTAISCPRINYCRRVPERNSLRQSFEWSFWAWWWWWGWFPDNGTGRKLMSWATQIWVHSAVWPCELWSFLWLTSIVDYEMKKVTWHRCTVSQFWHQPGLGIGWKVLLLNRGRTRCLHPEACMSNTSLWALAVNLRTRTGRWGRGWSEGLEAIL